MSRVLVHHLPDGRAALVEDLGYGAPALARAVPVVQRGGNVSSIGRGPWSVGEPGCYECGFLWVSVAPAGCTEDELECLACGGMSGALPETLRCGAPDCGWVGRAVAPPGTPLVRQCGGCSRMTAVVATAGGR